MFCVDCGSKNSDKAKFCLECGRLLVKRETATQEKIATTEEKNITLQPLPIGNVPIAPVDPIPIQSQGQVISGYDEAPNFNVMKEYAGTYNENTRYGFGDGEVSSSAKIALALMILAYIPGLFFCLLGFPCGIAAVILGIKERNAIHQGQSAPGGKQYASLAIYGGALAVMVVPAFGFLVACSSMFRFNPR